MHIYKKSHALAIIPARSGSKAIPSKNLTLCAGRPLIQWTLDAVKESLYISETLISTNCPAIASVCETAGFQVPFLRPQYLACDNSLSTDVINHALGFFLDNHQFYPEYIVLLQPTSPLRKAFHIDEALTRFFSTNCADSIVSVVRTDHSSIPESVMRIDDGFLKPYLPLSTIMPRQFKPMYYSRNGAAIYAIKTAVFLATKSLIGERCIPYEMHPYYSIDVDSPLDLAVATHFLLNPDLAPS